MPEATATEVDGVAGRPGGSDAPADDAGRPIEAERAAAPDRAMPARDAPAITGAGVVIRPGVSRRSQRLLEIIPGVVTWALILAPVALSWRFPQVVAWFVLTFDFYWFYKAVMLTGSVVVSFTRIRRITAIDWRERTFALSDPAARRAELDRRIERVVPAIAALHAKGNRAAASGGRAELTRLRDERKDLERLLARRGSGLPDPTRLWHVALIPTYTEPFDKLYETVAALARADWPTERKMVAIITRETDTAGREN
ncbi:MAG TPA: hypothetical protein VFI28_13130, partial [Candidatus Limnocylindrales bacterium]|nr:hypothetical protein [Candidatus Limnocylindrales bacterium]